jgi:hypothetical protein
MIKKEGKSKPPKTRYRKNQDGPNLPTLEKKQDYHQNIQEIKHQNRTHHK